MNRFRSKFCILWLLALALLGFLGCDYGRMKDQESLRPYKSSLPDMPAGIMPVDGGLQLLRMVQTDSLTNPLSNTPESIERGKISYGYFCLICHGQNYDGQGSVGQSFSPLPANLRGPYVQNQTDGTLFNKISLGFKRHPSMAYTVSGEDRWALIYFLRTLKPTQ